MLGTRERYLPSLRPSMTAPGQAGVKNGSRDRLVDRERAPRGVTVSAG
jgi:hypothetical protein